MTRCCETKGLATNAMSLSRDRDLKSLGESECHPRKPSRTRRKHRSNDPYQKRRYRSVRALARPNRAGGSPRLIWRTDIRPADICRAPSCTNASASSRDSSKAPLRPRRGSLPIRSDRRVAPSKSDRLRSKVRARNKDGIVDPKYRAGRPRPSDTRGFAHGRAESSPSNFRKVNNLREPSPIVVPIDTVPSVSSFSSAPPRAEAADVLQSWLLPCPLVGRAADSLRRIFA